MLSEVKRTSLARGFETTERCHITEIANDRGTQGGERTAESDVWI